MTLVDGLALVAGFAMAFVAIEGPKIGPPFGVTPGMMLFFVVMMFLGRATLAIAVVAVARVATYRRMPRPAEWLALLVAALFLAVSPEFQVDEWVNRALAAFGLTVEGPLSFSGWRWTIAGLESMVILVGLRILCGPGRRFAPWAKTLGLAGVAMLSLVGPFPVLGLEGPNLISPSAGFGPGELSILHREACSLAAQVPIGVFFGIPAIASLAGARWSGRSDPKSWVEWASLVLVATIFLCRSLAYRFEFNLISPWWPAERGLLLAWFVLVALVSRLIVVRFGPAWRRWADRAADQERASPSRSD